MENENFGLEITEISENPDFQQGTLSESKESKEPVFKENITRDLEENASTVTSDGDYIIDNLSPTWSILLTVQDNLNLRIGTQLKKKYFNAGFWNYISTPINFTITLLTAFSTGQTGSGSAFLTETQLFYVLLTTFILSIVNTFFKLKEKAEINYRSAKSWELYAATFEKIYFTPIDKNEDVATKLKQYNELVNKINTENKEETVEYVNYITEMFFYLFRLCRIYRDYRHLGIKERHWILDGSTTDFYRDHLEWFSDKNDMIAYKTYELDSKIFRKDLSKTEKKADQIKKYYFF